MKKRPKKGRRLFFSFLSSFLLTCVRSLSTASSALAFFPAANSAEAYRPWIPCVEGASCVKCGGGERENGMGERRGDEQGRFALSGENDRIQVILSTHVERQLLARRRGARRERPRGLLLLGGGVDLVSKRRKKRVSEMEKTEESRAAPHPGRHRRKLSLSPSLALPFFSLFLLSLYPPTLTRFSARRDSARAAWRSILKGKKERVEKRKNAKSSPLFFFPFSSRE